MRLTEQEYDRLAGVAGPEVADVLVDIFQRLPGEPIEKPSQSLTESTSIVTDWSIVALCGFAAIMSFVALSEWPYQYYTFLRYAVCIVCTWSAYRFYLQHKARKQNMVWLCILMGILGVTALTFNPIVPLRLSRESWQAIDVGAGVLLLTIAIASAITAKSQRYMKISLVGGVTVATVLIPSMLAIQFYGSPAILPYETAVVARDLPSDQLAKLETSGNINQYGNLVVEVYNGSDWSVTELFGEVDITIAGRNVHRRYVFTNEYKTKPNTSGIFSLRTDVGNGNVRLWKLLRASGYPDIVKQ